MTRRTIVASLTLVLGLGAAGALHAHCEVPCGIYGDRTRIDLLYEDVATIEKAMKQITELTGEADAQSLNQRVRWITTKEEHAERVQEITWQYFMTQRVKPAEDEAGRKKYLEQLTTLHGMLQAAMKTKQTVDTQHTQRLRALIDAFAASYFSADDLEHIREHHGKHAD